MMYLAGHEFGHTLEFQNPALYAKLKSAILGASRDWSAYREKLRLWDYDPSKHESEFVNDFIGSQWLEPRFWEELEASEPRLFTRMAKAAIRFLDGLLEKIAGFSRDVRPFGPSPRAGEKQSQRASESA